MNDQKDYKFTFGGVSEYREWEIRMNSPLYHNNEKPCPHCKQEWVVIKYLSESTRKLMWVCPKTIFIKTASGYDSTEICLDCVLEQVRKNELD